MRAMLSQAIRAARLNRAVYGGLEADADAILHALGAVILAGIAVGLGLMGVVVDLVERPGEVGSFVDRLLGLWLAIMTMMVGWIVWTAIIYLLGSRFLGGRARFRIILRALGICYGPAVLLVLISVPLVGDPASLLGAVWVLAAAVVATHEIQDMDWLGATLATVPGWFIAFLLLPVFLLEPLVVR